VTERMRRKKTPEGQEVILTCPRIELRAKYSSVGTENAKTFSKQNI